MAKQACLLFSVFLLMPVDSSKMKRVEPPAALTGSSQVPGEPAAVIQRSAALPSSRPGPGRGGAWSLAPSVEIEGIALAADGQHVAHQTNLAIEAHQFLGDAKNTPYPTHSSTDWQHELQQFRTGKPLVSVVMPTSADREQFFESALSNFLRQDYPNKELVVLSSKPAGKSGSGAGEQLRFWRDAATKYDNIRFEELNSSEPAAVSIGAKRNALLAKSKGSYIATFDDDDLYHEQYLSRMTEQLLLHRADLVKSGRFDAFIYFDDAHSPPGAKSPSGIFVHSNLANLSVVHEMFGYGFLYVFRRAAVDSLGCRYPHTNFGEDWEFVRQIARKGGKAVMLSHSPFPGIVVKVQHGHQTSNLINMGKSSLNDLQMHEIAVRFAQTHHLRKVSVATIEASQQCKYESDTDTVSDRYLVQAWLSEEECCGFCRVFPSCSGYALSSRGCYLKSARQIKGGMKPTRGVRLGTK